MQPSRASGCITTGGDCTRFQNPIVCSSFSFQKEVAASMNLQQLAERAIACFRPDLEVLIVLETPRNALQLPQCTPVACTLLQNEHAQLHT